MKTLTLQHFKPKYDLEIHPATSNSVSDFVRYYDEIDFEVKLSTGKNLQRDFVWTIEQKQEFIKTMIHDKAVPPIYVILYREENSRKSTVKVIDGKQRLSTAIDFLNNKFPLTIDGEDYYFENFDKDLQYAFRHRFHFNVHIVYEYHDQIIPDKDLIYLFEMVNFAGTPQDKEHMTNLLKEIK